MRVLDSDDEQAGIVSTTKMGDPGAVTGRGEGQRSPTGVVSGVIDAFLGAEPRMPEQRAEQLLRTGYLRIDATGWFARDLYAAADEIDHVDSGVVRLRVPRARLVPRT